MQSREKPKRPVINVPTSVSDLVLEIIGAAGLIFIFYLAVNWWNVLPDNIPRYFGFSGKVDSWGGKETIIVLPAVVFILYNLLNVFGRYPHMLKYPFRITGENAAVQYRLGRTLLKVLKAEIVWMFAYIQWVIIQVAMDRASGLADVFYPLAASVLVGTLVIYLYLSLRSR